MPIDPIDYSRPVGWWCPVCGLEQGISWAEANGLAAPPTRCNGYANLYHMPAPVIPVYLPLPIPEPVEVDEVETGEAEVVTVDNPTPFVAGLVVATPDITDAQFGLLIARDLHWCPENETFDAEAINRIAAASDSARRKREGAK